MTILWRCISWCNGVLFYYIVAPVVQIFGMVMIAAILFQIFSRTFFRVPFPWTDELARGTFIWFCFLGSAMAMRQYAHLGIDYFRSRLGERGQWLSDIVVCLAVILFGVLLATYGWQFLQMVGRQRTPILRISMQWFYLVIPLAGGLLALQGLEFLCQYLASGKPRPPLEEPVLPSTEEMAKLF
ncbi:MAG: TRAP transporter small permease [Planctomycetes bacterium]|nr:TRAP transporter small permease [Planctomycetota bacterium]